MLFDKCIQSLETKRLHNTEKRRSGRRELKTAQQAKKNTWVEGEV